MSQYENEDVRHYNEIKAFNELDNMNLNIKDDIDYKEEIYKGIKDKYENIN